MKTYLYMHYGTYPPDINSKLSMFFLRTTPGAIMLPNNLEEAHQILPNYFEFGLLNSHPLYMLSQLLTKVYTPLLSYRGDDRLIPRSKPKIEEKASVDNVDNEKAARVSLKKKH